MLSFLHRSNEKELLDETGIPYEDLKTNMQELNVINTLLGGHHITLQGFKQLLGSRKAIRVAEIGCGGGDNIAVIQRYCQQRQIVVQAVGIDREPHICAYAEAKHPAIQIQCCDYREAVFAEPPDIIFSSLFCHHFNHDQLVEQILWMKEKAGIGFFINDLHRHVIAYYSIKILTKLFSRSYLVKHDAPLSVARAFTYRDWEKIFAEAGLKPASVEWKWAFRYLILYRHGT